MSKKNPMGNHGKKSSPTNQTKSNVVSVGDLRSVELVEDPSALKRAIKMRRMELEEIPNDEWMDFHGTERYVFIPNTRWAKGTIVINGVF